MSTSLEAEEKVLTTQLRWHTWWHRHGGAVEEKKSFTQPHHLDQTFFRDFRLALWHIRNRKIFEATVVKVFFTIPSEKVIEEFQVEINPRTTPALL